MTEGYRIISYRLLACKFRNNDPFGIKVSEKSSEVESQETDYYKELLTLNGAHAGHFLVEGL